MPKIKQCDCSISEKVRNSSKKDLGMLEMSFRKISSFMLQKLKLQEVHKLEKSIVKGPVW